MIVPTAIGVGYRMGNVQNWQRTADRHSKGRRRSLPTHSRKGPLTSWVVRRRAPRIAPALSWQFILARHHERGRGIMTIQPDQYELEVFVPIPWNG
jgi:hypothetical protein